MKWLCRLALMVTGAAVPALGEIRSGPAATITTSTTADVPNAAGLYREAFDLIATLDEAEGRRLGLCGTDGCWVVKTPLDDATAALLDQQQRAVALARDAAALREARWELRGDSSKIVKLANRGPRLSALLVLQARHELRDGDAQQAVDDLLAAMALSRHVASEPTVMTKLVELAAWRPAAEALALHLPTLPKQILATLPNRLAQMPSSPTVEQVLRGEQTFARASAKDQGVAGAIMAQGLKEYYDVIAPVGHLPPDQFARLVDEHTAKSPNNIWAKMLSPSLKRTRESAAVHEARQAMLLTAIEILQKGEKALAASKDPFGDGPFIFRRTPNGFELASALTVRDKPVTLGIGEERDRKDSENQGNQ